MNQEDEAIINLLPDELLLEVFRLLKATGLKNSSLVCKKWNGLIGQSSAVMRNLPLSLKAKVWLHVLQNTKDFTRKYQHIKIKENKEWNMNTLKTLKLLGSDLRVLELRDCVIDVHHAKFFNNFAPSLESLETLECTNTTFSNLPTEMKAFKSFHLPKLRSVVLQRSDLTILEIIKASQLTSLKIQGPANTDKNILIDFLVGQKNLEELALQDLKFEKNSVDTEKLKMIQFPLKRLSLGKQRNLLGSEENLLLFMNKFVSTLNQLEVGSKFPESFYVLIFRKLLRLKTLNIFISQAPTSSVFYHKLLPNSSIRKLIVQSSSTSYLKSLKGFLGNLPNVETLVLNTDYLSNKLIMFISANLLNLKNLQLAGVTEELFVNGNIPSLKSITINRLYTNALCVNFYQKMIKALPNVENFSIKRVNGNAISNDYILKGIKGWAHLRDLTLGQRFEVYYSKKLIQLLNSCKNLQRIEVDNSCFKECTLERKDEVLKEFSRKNVQFAIRAQVWNDFWNFNGCCFELWNNTALHSLRETDIEDKENRHTEKESIFYNSDGSLKQDFEAIEIDENSFDMDAFEQAWLLDQEWLRENMWIS